MLRGRIRIPRRFQPRLTLVSIYVLDQDEAKDFYTKKLEATFRDNSGNWFSLTQTHRPG